MAEPPDLDLFGAPIAPPTPPSVPKPGPKPAAKAAPRRPTIIREPEPPRPVLGPPLMGPTPGGPAVPPPPPAMPRYATRLLAVYEACSCCGRQADVALKVRREHCPDERLALCRNCRTAGGETAPARAEGLLAGPWVVAWLREAGRLPYEPRRGCL